MFNIKKRILFLCFVIYACLAVGINPKRYFGECFFYFKREKVFCTIVIAEGIQSLVLDKVFHYLLQRLLEQLLRCIE